MNMARVYSIDWAEIGGNGTLIVSDEDGSEVGRVAYDGEPVATCRETDSIVTAVDHLFDGEVVATERWGETVHVTCEGVG
jgi:hypothetical protein